MTHLQSLQFSAEDWCPRQEHWMESKLVKNSRFFNIKEPNFQQRQQSFLAWVPSNFGL